MDDEEGPEDEGDNVDAADGEVKQERNSQDQASPGRRPGRDTPAARGVCSSSSRKQLFFYGSLGCQDSDRAEEFEASRLYTDLRLLQLSIYP